MVFNCNGAKFFFAGIPRLLDEPSVMQEVSKRRKSDSAGDAGLTGFNVSSSHGASACLFLLQLTQLPMSAI